MTFSLVWVEMVTRWYVTPAICQVVDSREILIIFVYHFDHSNKALLQAYSLSCTLQLSSIRSGYSSRDEVGLCGAWGRTGSPGSRHNVVERLIKYQR